jgi:GAF domain-containing protein
MDIRILEISDNLSQICLSMKERLQVLSERLAECLEKRCCIYVVKENSENYFFLIAGCPREFHGIGRKFSFKGHLPLEKVLREKKPFLIENTEISPLLNGEQKDWARGTGTKSILFVPIVFHQREILGIIVLDIVRDEEISEEEINFIQQVASHVAWAINNAAVYEELEKKEAELAKAVRLATLGEE